MTRRLPTALLEMMIHRHSVKGPTGNSSVGRCLIWLDRRRRRRTAVGHRASHERDSYAVFGDKLIMTLFRHLELGVNPAFEIGRFLTRTSFTHVLPLVGALEYRTGDDTVTIGVLHEHVPNTVPAWQFASDARGPLLRTLVAQPADHRPVVSPAAAKASLWDLADGDVPPLATELLGEFLDWAARWASGPANSIWPCLTIMGTRTSRRSRFRHSTKDRSINRRTSWPYRFLTSCATDGFAAARCSTTRSGLARPPTRATGTLSEIVARKSSPSAFAATAIIILLMYSTLEEIS